MLRFYGGSGRSGGGGGGGHGIGSMFVMLAAYLAVIELCEHRPSCSVLASQETFEQDPCKGTSKYLEVHYKCRPDDFERHTVCEGDEMEIWCGKGDRIAVFSAMFGRRPNGTDQCPANKQGYIDCQAEHTLIDVRKHCHGKKTCALQASSNVFEDPCPRGINKYLTVSYACVPKKYLKPLNHNSPGTKKKRKRKKKKRKKKKKKNKSKNRKKKGGKRLLPEILEPPTEYPPEYPSESTLDTLYETHAREEVTQTTVIRASPDTSTEELILPENVDSQTWASMSESTKEISNITTEASTEDSHSVSSPSLPPLSTETTTMPTVHSRNETSKDFNHYLPEVTTHHEKRLQNLSMGKNKPTTEDIPVQTSNPNILLVDSTVVPDTVTNLQDSFSEESTIPSHDFDTSESEVSQEYETTSSKTDLEMGSDFGKPFDIIKSDNKDNIDQGLRSDNLTSTIDGRNSKDNSNIDIESSSVADNIGRVRGHSDTASTVSNEVSTKPVLDKASKNNDNNNKNVIDKGNEDKKNGLVTQRNVTVVCVDYPKPTTDVLLDYPKPTKDVLLDYPKPTKDVVLIGSDKPRDTRTIGFIKDWFSNIRFLEENEEKAWLYFTLGMCFGIISLLVFIMVKLCINYKRNIRARLDVSEPTHRSANINNHSSMDAPMLEHSDSMDRIEVVRFSPRGTLRSMRSNSHNRDIVNYYG